MDKVTLIYFSFAFMLGVIQAKPFNNSISKMRPFWNVFVRGSDFFTLETTVLAVDHASQAAELNDIEIPGHEGAVRYYRIRTPLVKKSGVMYRYTMIGYTFVAAKPIDAIWVGYLESHCETVMQSFSEVKYIDKPHYTAQATFSFDQDDHLVLYLGPINRSGNGFELRYQGHYQNATMGLKVDEYSVTAY